MIYKSLMGIVMCAAMFSSVLADTKMGLASGRETGTYYRFGEDMARVAALNKINLTIYPSRGAIQNLEALYNRQNIQLAITQADVLYFLNLLGNEQTIKLLDSIRIVMPLYREEVHVLAREGIKAFADLAGKTVAIGEPGSGTAMTSQILFRTVNIQPGNTMNLENKDALTALIKGEVDAAIMVAGIPMRLLQEEIPQDSGVYLVPLTDPRVFDTYGDEAVTIPAGTYPWQATAVQTLAIMSVLMTPTYPDDAVECQAVKRLSQAIADNLDWLRTHGHAKWAEVQLDFPVAEENRAGCSALYR